MARAKYKKTKKQEVVLTLSEKEARALKAMVSHFENHRVTDDLFEVFYELGVDSSEYSVVGKKFSRDDGYEDVDFEYLELVKDA